MHNSVLEVVEKFEREHQRDFKNLKTSFSEAAGRMHCLTYVAGWAECFNDNKIVNDAALSLFKDYKQRVGRCFENAVKQAVKDNVLSNGMTRRIKNDVGEALNNITHKGKQYNVLEDCVEGQQSFSI